MKSAIVKTMADEKGRDHCSLIFGCVFGLREVVGKYGQQGRGNSSDKAREKAK
jgi:hypothetical protein